jgi:hypothetical protein
MRISLKKKNILANEFSLSGQIKSFKDTITQSVKIKIIVFYLIILIRWV